MLIIGSGVPTALNNPACLDAQQNVTPVWKR